MDKDKFYKPNQKDMAVMKKIHHHHMASMQHSTDSPKHKHHIQQVMKHKSQLSKDAQKLLMMGEGTYKVEIEGLPKMYMDTDNPGELRRDLRKIVRKVDMVKNVERVQKSQVRKDLQLKIQGKDDIDESLNETKVIVGKHLDKAGIPYSYAGGPEPMVRQKDAGRAKELINKLHKDGTIKRNPGVTVYDKGPNIRPISKALKNKLGIKELAMKSKPRKGRQTPQELETMKLYNYAMKQKPGSPERKNVMNTLNRKRQEMGKPPIKELAMGQGIEVKKTKIGEVPKGIGWSLKKLGKHTGKDHDVWHRVTKPVAQPKIRAGSPMYSSKNESFFFVAEDQIKKDGAKIKKAYAAIATEDMNVITKHLKKQGIDHDHDKGELYVRRQDHRDVMNHLNDLMKKKMIKSKPPVTAEKLDKDDEPFIKNLIKNLRKGSKTHGGQADDLEKAMKEARGVPRKHAKTYSNLNLKKARELMSPAKHRQDGIDRIAKGMGISKAKAAKHHDDVMKSYGFKPEGKAYGPTGVSYYVPKGHPSEVDPKTREKYPERQTAKYKADYAKNSPLKLSGKFSKNENAFRPPHMTKKDIDIQKAKLSPKAQRAKDAQARIDKKFAPGGSYSKGADQIRKVIANNESVDEIVTRRGKPIFQPKPGDSPERTAMIKSVQKSLNKRRERLAKAKKDRAAAYAQGKDFDMVKALGYGTSVKEDVKAAIKKKADKSGMPAGILRQVYNRGVAAWRTGHRPGTTPSQWGHARVNSFVTKSSGTWGKADKDLADKVRARKK